MMESFFPHLCHFSAQGHLHWWVIHRRLYHRSIIQKSLVKLRTNEWWVHHFPHLTNFPNISRQKALENSIQHSLLRQDRRTSTFYLIQYDRDSMVPKRSLIPIVPRRKSPRAFCSSKKKYFLHGKMRETENARARSIEKPVNISTLCLIEVHDYFWAIDPVNHNLDPFLRAKWSPIALLPYPHTVR